MTDTLIVPVALGDRSYEIAIGQGLLAEAGQRIRAVNPQNRLIVIADAAVAKIHGAKLNASLDAVESGAPKPCLLGSVVPGIVLDEQAPAAAAAAMPQALFTAQLAVGGRVRLEHVWSFLS